MNVAAHQEKEKNEKTSKRKAGEDRPILKRLRAALLRTFRGRKIRQKNGLFERSAWGNWDPR